MSGDTEGSAGPHEHCFHEIRRDTHYWHESPEVRTPDGYYTTKTVTEVCCGCGEVNRRYEAQSGGMPYSHRHGAYTEASRLEYLVKVRY